MRFSSAVIKYTISVFLSVTLISGCASNSAEKTQPVSPVQPPPAPVQQDLPETVSEAVPEIPENLKHLRESLASGNTTAAESAAHALIEENPDSEYTLEALQSLSAIALNNGQTQIAQFYAEKALETAPEDWKTLSILAQISHDQHKEDDAIRYLNKAISANPDIAENHWKKATILLSFLDYQRALDEAAAAYKISPNDCSSLVVYADALYASHQFEDAVSKYESADAAECSLTSAAILNMAKLYEVQLQNAKKACQTYRRLVSMEPDNPYYKASMDYQCAQN